MFLSLQELAVGLGPQSDCLPCSSIHQISSIVLLGSNKWWIFMLKETFTSSMLLPPYLVLLFIWTFFCKNRPLFFPTPIDLCRPFLKSKRWHRKIYWRVSLENTIQKKGEKPDSFLLIYWRVSSKNTIQEKGNNLIHSYPSAPQLRQLFWGIIHHIHGKDWMP